MKNRTKKKRIELKIYGDFCLAPNGERCISGAHTNIGHIIQTGTKLHRNNNEMVRNHRSAGCLGRRGIRADFLLHNNACMRIINTGIHSLHVPCARKTRRKVNIRIACDV